METAEQLRAARGILHLTQVELAALCGLSNVTIHRLEQQEGELNGLASNIRKIAGVLQDHGIVFVKGGAYRRARTKRLPAPELAEAS